MKKFSFKKGFILYLAVLLALVVAATAYVGSVLKNYEARQPEQAAQAVVQQLQAAAADGSFWNDYTCPELTPGKWEQGMDIKQSYLAQFAEEVSLQKENSTSEDELSYLLTKNGHPLVRIYLQAEGETQTQLLVFSTRNWQVAKVEPMLESRDYALTVPANFSISVNGHGLTAEDGKEKGNGDMAYTLQGLYLAPVVSVHDAEGNPGNYRLKENRVVLEQYRYDLALPHTLTVTVNGAVVEGKESNGLLLYNIRMLKEPAVEITDLYGNKVTYDGSTALPLSYLSVSGWEGCAVTVNGTAVPEEAISRSIHADHQHFADYVEGLPQQCIYTVAVLQDQAKIAVTDSNGNAVTWEDGVTELDLTDTLPRLEEIPAEVSDAINVLDVAQKWSLFMSNDMDFSLISTHLIPGSYQHSVATKYANGIDITFTSRHVLLDPPFTENSVTNFTWLTEDCFSVDIHFVKHMHLSSGLKVDDTMNDRFYFVRYNDQWKLASMKEIIYAEK